MNNSVQKIVSMYRAREQLTQDEFAKALTDEIVDQTLTGAAVSFWEAGKRVPQATFLIRVGMAYQDWRKDFAFDLLAATIGNAYQPRGPIGRHVILGETLPLGTPELVGGAA